MKDASIERLASFATSVTVEDLPDEVLDRVGRHLVDTLGCLIGGYDAPPATAIRRSSAAVADARDAGLVVGAPDDRLSLTDASRLNTVRTRYLDHNDTFPGGHPSDLLGAIWAGSRGRSGRDVVAAAVVGYEIFNRLCRMTDLRGRGWDQGCMVALAATAALARLRGLSAATCADAVAIAAVTTVHLRATRSGPLSAWKACATAQAVAGAVDAVRFAAAGIDGPPAALDGRHGVAELVTGPLDWPAFPTEGGEHWVLRTGLKFWPVEYGLQPAVWLARRCRGSFPTDLIDAITVVASPTTAAETASSDRWRPTSRESADHSLPYVFARTLISGAIDEDSFTPDALTEEQVIAVADRVCVDTDPGLGRGGRGTDGSEGPTMRCRVELRDGSIQELEQSVPLGDPARPMSADQVADKLRAHARGRVASDEVEVHLVRWQNLVDEEDVGHTLGTLVVRPRNG